MLRNKATCEHTFGKEMARLRNRIPALEADLATRQRVVDSRLEQELLAFLTSPEGQRLPPVRNARFEFAGTGVLMNKVENSCVVLDFGSCLDYDEEDGMHVIYMRFQLETPPRIFQHKRPIPPKDNSKRCTCGECGNDFETVDVVTRRISDIVCPSDDRKAAVDDLIWRKQCAPGQQSAESVGRIVADLMAGLRTDITRLGANLHEARCILEGASKLEQPVFKFLTSPEWSFLPGADSIKYHTEQFIVEWVVQGPDAVFSVTVKFQLEPPAHRDRISEVVCPSDDRKCVVRDVQQRLCVQHRLNKS